MGEDKKFGWNMMLKMPIRCAKREKYRAECWINKSEFWGLIWAGVLRTAGVCVDSCSLGLDKVIWTGTAEGEDKKVEVGGRRRSSLETDGKGGLEETRRACSLKAQRREWATV